MDETDKREVESQEPRLLLVDTNCFLRIYYSPLRPFLGTQVGNYEIFTLISLVDEVHGSNRLEHEYAWVREDLIREATNGVLPPLPPGDAKEVAEQVKLLRAYANSFLEKHAVKNGKPTRPLSGRDLELLATAAHYGAVIASDEWPLALVVEDLTIDEEDNYEIEMFTSVDILHLLEQAGLLSAEDRRDTVRSWQRCSENLHRNWRTLYQNLFGEAPPSIQ